MTRSELIDKLAMEKDISNTVAEKIVAEIFKSMTDTLMSGNRIDVRGFGSFKVREYDGHTGMNPSTGIKVKVAPKKLPFFKVGKDLQERIQDGDK